MLKNYRFSQLSEESKQVALSFVLNVLAYEFHYMDCTSDLLAEYIAENSLSVIGQLLFKENGHLSDVILCSNLEYVDMDYLYNAYHSSFESVSEWINRPVID